MGWENVKNKGEYDQKCAEKQEMQIENFIQSRIDTHCYG